MRTLVIFGLRGDPAPEVAALPTVTVDGVTVRCAVVETDDDGLDPRAAGAGHAVLLRIRAFSLNYRDKWQFMSQVDRPADEASRIGSEFVADVVAIGPSVTRVAVGDRVVANHAYTGAAFDADGVPAGIPSNGAGTELLVLDENKLLRIPGAMPDAVAAAFSLGAQTAYSMVRRSGCEPGMRVLVPAGSSNTSLFLIDALRRLGASVYTTATSARRSAQLQTLGVAGVATLPAADRVGRREGLAAFGRGIGGFDCVLDPFADLHLEGAVEAMRPGGRYVSCGYVAQNDYAAAAAGHPCATVLEVFPTIMRKNLTVIGNCLGETHDLARAVDDYAAGEVDVRVDSVFGDDDAAGFIHRSYAAPDRFGKVVLSYVDGACG